MKMITEDFKKPSPIYDEADIQKLLLNVKSHAEKIVSLLNISNNSGRSVSIMLSTLESEKGVCTNVNREQRDPPIYNITLDTGLIRHLLIAAESIVDTPNHKVTFNVGKSTVNNGELKRNSEQAISSAFWLSANFVILHEFAHVYLGHLDYLYDDMKFDLNTTKNTLSCEADADRQACQWLTEFFSVSIAKNLFYERLYFSSKAYAYEFYFYVFASFFKDLSEEDDDTHPKSYQRLLTVFSGLLMYLEKNAGAEYDQLALHLMIAFFNVDRPFYPKNYQDYLTKLIKDLPEFMSFDRYIAETEISKYRGKIKVNK